MARPFVQTLKRAQKNWDADIHFLLQTLKPNCPGILDHSTERHNTHTHTCMTYCPTSHSKNAIHAPQHIWHKIRGIMELSCMLFENVKKMTLKLSLNHSQMWWRELLLKQNYLTSISKTCSLSSRKTTRRANKLSFCSFRVFSDLKSSGCFLLQLILMSPLWIDTLKISAQFHIL